KKTPRKQKSGARGRSSQPRVEKSPASTAPSPETPASAFPIVGIGASAGGLEAVTHLLEHLPADTGMGFVLVQHLDPDHESALAQDQHECAVGVILSGTASDGTLGTEAIKAEGGITFAQDKSARYDSMPRSAIAAGCVDFVLSPETIAKELARIARHPYVAGQPLVSTPRSPLEGERKKGEGSEDKGTGQNGFQKILFLLRNHF